MSSSHDQGNSAVPSNRRTAVWIVLMLVGLAGGLACGLLCDSAAAWRALFVNFVFFTPLAAAMVVWPAVVMLSRGRWMGPVQRDGLAGIAFAPFSIAAFIALWLGRAHWAPWLANAALPNRAWMDERFLFARDGIALMVWWLVAFWFTRKARGGRPKVLAGWVGFLYGVVFSLLGFDLVMGLDPHWASSLFGVYYFVSGMYAAIAVLAFAATRNPRAEPGRLHDLGKLVLTFSIVTTYLMFSQLLPIWYENLPQEVRFVAPRMMLAPWVWVSAALVAAVYLGPLVLLLTVRAKRTPWYLGAVSLWVAAGLWVERWWLVAPTLGQGVHLSGADIFLCAACVGALGWGVSRSRRCWPEVPEETVSHD